MGPLFYVGTLIGFLMLGYFVGGFFEKWHYQDLERRESLVAGVLATQIKSFPLGVPTEQPPTMLVAETVVSSDYMKSFLAAWKRFFGGEIRSFRSIMERARREALVQLKEQAAEAGYNAICNIRVETVDVGGRGSNQKNKIVMASVMASGTAYVAGETSSV